ncbi:hypothetical protein Dimus_013772, partial [Dionaea muscipula]
MEYTVFVDDLPASMQRSDFKILFVRFGNVIDVFIPIKRSKKDTRFGFVRYNCEVAVSIAVEKGNRVWVKDRSLIVKMAEYGRQQKQMKIKQRRSREDEHSGRFVSEGKRLHEENRVMRQIHNRQAHRSYRDVVQGANTVHEGPNDKVIPIIQGDTSGEEWLNRSVIVERAACRGEGLHMDMVLAEFEFK